MEITDQPGSIAADASISTQPQPVSFFKQININAFWIANNFHWNALLAVIIPSMVAKLLDPAYKSINLPLVVSWGTIVAVIVNPLTGAISDYATFRMGRRRPFLIIGTILNVVVLIAFAFTPSLDRSILLAGLAVLFILLQFSNNLANAPWSAIIADQVPSRQRGVTSGLFGLFTLLGTALGAVVAGQIINKQDALPLYKSEIVQIFLLIALVQIVFVAYTVITVKETPLAPELHVRFELAPFLRKFFFKPSRYPDLSWVLLARLLVMMGIWGIFYFLQYYADDVLHVSGEQFIGSVFLPVLLLAALPTSIVAGWASDRWGRKGLVYLSGIMMTLVCGLFILFQTTTGALVGAVCFGIGYGAYTSVDWALTADVLPPTDEAGKFLGIWSAMGIIPQVVGITVGGILLQVLQGLPNHFGYTALFLVTILYFALGTAVIYQVKGAK